jgi:hypothetical protein
MRKMLILTLALWAGVSNFAYASARIECAGMMEQSACPAAMPCQCSIQAPSSERTLPADMYVQFGPLQAGLPVVISDVTMPDHWRMKISPFESPPKHPPLYQLFSVYRI